jgi:trimeric autotransporter adhesin
MHLADYRLMKAVAVFGSLLGCANVALAQVPAALQVTAGADLKQLIFDWEPVPGATSYQLFHKPTRTASFSPVGEPIPASLTQTRVNVAVHLERWSVSRYLVAACNASGCQRSEPVAVSEHMLDAIGYFKASNTDANDSFGLGVALSADGATLAVSAPEERSNATGVNGNQANDSVQGSGAVYLFHREGRRWRQEAYVKSPVSQTQQYFGFGYPFGQQAIALNGSGSLLAAGAPGENVDGVTSAGRVYVYRRSSTGSWSRVATLRSPTLLQNDFFGMSVDMSADGSTLKVNSLQPQDGEGNPELRTHIFVRAGSTWAHSVTIAPPVPGEFCQTVRLSGDGQTLISSCWGYVGSPSRFVTLKRNGNTWVPGTDLPVTSARTVQPLALNFDGTRFAYTHSTGLDSEVRTFSWDGAGWVQDATLRSPIPPIDINTFGSALAFDRHGTMLVVGDTFSAAAGAGVSETAVSGSEEEGAVYVYRRGDNTRPWALRSVVKAPNPSRGNLVGSWLALSCNGRVLAVGAPYESSAATGIDGDRSDTSAPAAGAVYLY